jgi:hypothetical protein
MAGKILKSSHPRSPAPRLAVPSPREASAGLVEAHGTVAGRANFTTPRESEPPRGTLTRKDNALADKSRRRFLWPVYVAGAAIWAAPTWELELTKVQNDSGLPLAEVNAALKDGIDIVVGSCYVRVPAQAVADARAAWSALRAEAGEDAAQRIFEAMAATLPQRLEAAARAFEIDLRPNKRIMNGLVNDLVWRHVVGH